ncbi:hypothetical protein AVEN_227800-1 [Araneus ventricosus]|uniref:Uncharacterized protein n=1 Tax=Araneus ventricosus TaxID=182803 RepID=A0A4Y2C585_ARAVE|nr:hypothetical protein AVEN_227800-1 [Araneus ventricosus]
MSPVRKGLKSRPFHAKQIRPYHAKTDRRCEKPVAGVLSELAWCGVEGWISSLSQYPALHLDRPAINCSVVGACVCLVGKIRVSGIPRKSEKAVIGVTGYG